MSLSNKKEMSAKLLKVGVKKVRFKLDSMERIEDAATRDDLRKLIRARDIYALQPRGISTGRKKARLARKSKRGRTAGSKEGKATTRTPRKRAWINQVRPLRGYLRLLKSRGELTKPQFNTYYLKVKGGDVRTMRRLKELIAEAKGAR